MFSRDVKLFNYNCYRKALYPIIGSEFIIYSLSTLYDMRKYRSVAYMVMKILLFFIREGWQFTNQMQIRFPDANLICGRQRRINYRVAAACSRFH